MGLFTLKIGWDLAWGPSGVRYIDFLNSASNSNHYLGDTCCHFGYYVFYSNEEKREFIWLYDISLSPQAFSTNNFILR
jgi:hypothetical protein